MTLTAATIKVGNGSPVPVQFNPASLRVTTTNQLQDDHPNQVSKPTAFKLDVELLFDSTDDGSDVHRKTRAIRYAAIATAQGATAANRTPGGPTSMAGQADSGLSLVTFTWGTSNYRGYIESLNETLDYWSSDGVPLRSTIQISLKGTTENFLTGSYGTVARYSENPAPPMPAIVTTSAASDQARFTRTAAAGGDGSTGRGLAALNGVENMRGGAVAGASAAAAAGASAGAAAGAGAGVAAGAGAQLQAAAGFKLAGGVSAGASLGFGIGASAGLSASAGLGASVGVGLAAGAGFGASAGAGFGASAGAGFGAAAGVAAGAGAGFSAGATASAGFSSGSGGFATTGTSVTGFDGVTRTTTSSSQFGSSTAWGSASAGVSASAGAFAGLGASRTALPSAGFNPDRLLPPALPAGGATASYDVSGRAVSSDGQVAASYSARASVTVW